MLCESNVGFFTKVILLKLSIGPFTLNQEISEAILETTEGVKYLQADELPQSKDPLIN